MDLPFWEPGAQDEQGLLPGITSLIPPGTAPYPNELSAWDVVTLNGVRAPGICRIEGGKHIPYDRKAALGQLLGVPSLFVFDPTTLTLVLRIWTPGQWKEFQDLLPQLLPRPGPTPDPRAVRIEYPWLTLLDVSTVYFDGLEAPRMNTPGVMDFAFTCYEWKPPVAIAPKDVASPLPQTNTPGASRPTSTVTPPSQGSNLGP